MKSVSKPVTLDTSRPVRNERSHSLELIEEHQTDKLNQSLEFVEDDLAEPTLTSIQSEMDIDISATDQLLSDVDTLLDDVITPCAQACGSMPTLFSDMDYARLIGASDESSVSDDSNELAPRSTLTIRTPTLDEENRRKNPPTRAKKQRSKSPKELILQQRNLLGELTVRLEELISQSWRLPDKTTAASKKKSWWKLAAIRQIRGRREAEEENVRLRAMLELQVEEAKCLKRILIRRRKIQMMEDMLGMKRQKVEKSLVAPSDNNQIFAKMLRDVDDLYTNLDSTFTSKGFDEMPCPGQNRKVYRNVVNGIFYERQEKTEIPFDVQQTQEAVWKVLLDHGIGSVKRLKDLSSMVDFRNKLSDESTDTITSSYFAATPGISAVSGAQVRKVVRKYTADNKVVFIYKVVVEPRGKCTTTLLGYQLHSILRIVMRQRVSSADTLLSIYFSGQRQETDPSIAAKFRQPEQLDIDIAMWDKLILGIASEVENMLIDDTLESKATPRKSLEVAV